MRLRVRSKWISTKLEIMDRTSRDKHKFGKAWLVNWRLVDQEAGFQRPLRLH